MLALSKLLLNKTETLFCYFYHLRHFSQISVNCIEKKVKEVKIPVPWGHLSGKLWGNENQKPVLCLHGWQDNANSFDTLIPLLSEKYTYLAIDFPGHGCSSHYPKGVCYNINEFVTTIKRIQNHYQWPSISLICHSLASYAGYLYASFFPKTTDFFVNIDMSLSETWNGEKILSTLRRRIEKLYEVDSLNPENSPSYSKSELVEKLIKATKNSLTPRSCEILLERGAKCNNERYTLTRDIRIKHFFYHNFTEKENIHIANAIECAVLFIKAKESSFIGKEENLDLIKAIEKRAKYYEHHELPGTHHLHLNTPEIVAPVINSFLKHIENQHYIP